MTTEVKSVQSLPGGDEQVNLQDRVVRQSSYGSYSSGAPTVHGRNVRQMMKEVGPRNYRNHLRKLLGVTEVRDPRKGTVKLVLNESEAQIGADEFSLRDLANEFMGQDFVGSLHNSKTADHSTHMLQEALNPVTASNFQDINAFNQTIGGLIEVRILKGYQLPEYMADSLFETMPTRVNGGKLIGLPNVVLPDGPTQEGQEYPNVGMGERWVIAPPNVKYAQKLSLTRETLVYDLSGEVLTTAEQIGMTLGYIREYWCAGVAQGRDIVAGTPGFQTGRTCNTFLYKALSTDTANATYQTAAGTGASLKYNAVNQFTGSTGIVDWKNLQTVRAKLALMREPETGYPILAPFEEVLVSPGLVDQAKHAIHATQISDITPGYATTLNPTLSYTPPVEGNRNLRIHASAIWNKQLVDSGISQANADVYWNAGCFKRAFVWREVWNMGVVQANPLSTEMLGSDIINAFYASWYGVPMVRDMHYVLQFTN